MLRRPWIILGICVALGFGAGLLRRQLDSSLQSEREQELRRRIVGPAVFSSEAESSAAIQELRVINRMALASDLVSGFRAAALVALVWFLARAQLKWGVGLAVALFAFVIPVPGGVGADGKEILALAMSLLHEVVYGAGISVVVWIVAEVSVEVGETAS